MLSRIAIIVDPETTPQAVQEHSRERHRQLRVLLFAESESWPQIHEPAGARLHVEKHLGTTVLILGPNMIEVKRIPRNFKTIQTY